jgi:hypothetical protein
MENPAIARLQGELADLDRRCQNVLDQIEEYEPTGDDDIDREFRLEFRHRYTDLSQLHKTKANQLTSLAMPTPLGQDYPSLLDDLPLAALSLADVPEGSCAISTRASPSSCATSPKSGSSMSG